jgi:hypothetical protein
MILTIVLRMEMGDYGRLDALSVAPTVNEMGNG